MAVLAVLSALATLSCAHGGSCGSYSHRTTVHIAAARRPGALPTDRGPKLTDALLADAQQRTAQLAKRLGMRDMRRCDSAARIADYGSPRFGYLTVWLTSDRRQLAVHAGPTTRRKRWETLHDALAALKTHLEREYPDYTVTLEDFHACTSF